MLPSQIKYEGGEIEEDAPPDALKAPPKKDRDTSSDDEDEKKVTKKKKEVSNRYDLALLGWTVLRIRY